MNINYHKLSCWQKLCLKFYNNYATLGNVNWLGRWLYVSISFWWQDMGFFHRSSCCGRRLWGNTLCKLNNSILKSPLLASWEKRKEKTMQDQYQFLKWNQIKHTVIFLHIPKLQFSVEAYSLMNIKLHGHSFGVKKSLFSVFSLFPVVHVLYWMLDIIRVKSTTKSILLLIFL